MEITLEELAYLQDTEQHLDLSLLQSVLNEVLLEPPKMMMCRQLHSEADEDEVIASPGPDLLLSPSYFDAIESESLRGAKGKCNENCRGGRLEYMPLDVFQTDSGYTSLLSTPSRVGSTSGFSTADGLPAGCVMEQILNWSPCLPTPGALSPCGSKRSHSTESPVRPKVATNVRRQLFKSDSSSTNQRASSVLPVDRSLMLNSSRGRNSAVNTNDTNRSEEEISSVLNPEKYKTMHCRNFLAKGVCDYGGKCQFAHGSAELRVQSQHPKFKTEMCRNYEDFGYCEWRDACIFRHGESDLNCMKKKTLQKLSHNSRK